MRKSWHFAGLVVAALAVGGLGTSVVYGGSAGGGLSGPPDRRPLDAGRSLEARASTKSGVFGVLLYWNRSDQPCMAAGQVNGTVIGSGSGAEFLEMPLKDVGLCDLVPRPVAASVLHSREETTIYGVAADDVTKITVTAGRIQLETEPTDDHAFIVNTPRSLVGPVDLGAIKEDGSVESLRIADLPDLETLSRTARVGQSAAIAAAVDWRP